MARKKYDRLTLEEGYDTLVIMREAGGRRECIAAWVFPNPHKGDWKFQPFVKFIDDRPFRGNVDWRAFGTILEAGQRIAERRMVTDYGNAEAL